MIIAIEGTDAAGKATQSKLLADALGGEVVSFPDYTTPIGKLILSHLKDEWRATREAWNEMGGDFTMKAECDALVLQSLFVVNRLELLPRIEALVAAGTPVVLDRYWLSGVIYGGLDGVDASWLKDVHASLPKPDAWILIDVEPEESVRRRPERRDRYEKQAGLMERAREAYLEYFLLKRKYADDRRWTVIDGIGSLEEVHQRIAAAVAMAQQ